MSGVSRRDYLRAACAASMISPAVRAIEDGRTYTGRGRPLATLTGTLGVNVVSSTPNAPYGQYDVVLAALRDLGVTWIRSRIHTGNKGQVAWINQLAANGIRTNGLIALPGQKDTPEDLVALVAASMPSAILSLEGPNEWNLQGGANWAAELVEHQTRLWTAAKGSPVTRNLPIVAPALANRQGYTDLGDRTAILDWGNIHLYTNGYAPGLRTDDTLAGQRIVSGAKPIIVTETGWHYDETWFGPQRYTPEDVAGVYAPRLLLEYVIRNVPRMAIYELFDNPAAPTTWQRRFGLLRGDGTRRPAFTSLANLNTIVTRQYRQTGRPGQTVAFRFRGVTADLRSVLVDRADGRVLLFLWRSAAAIYDPPTRRRLPLDPVTITIDWGGSYRISRFVPSTSATALQSSVTTRSSVALGAELEILEIAPA